MLENRILNNDLYKKISKMDLNRKPKQYAAFLSCGKLYIKLKFGLTFKFIS